jgi:hypothetical protein
MIITILDFDDTLFPTSEYNRNKNIDTDKTYNSITKIINTIRIFSQIIYIITNASEEWVIYCFKHILNKPLDCLENVKIISTIDKGYTNDIHNSFWKKVAYEKVLTEYLDCYSENIFLFIGDSPYDRDGALHIMNSYPQHKVKSIKYQILPSLQALIKQHEHTTQMMVRILFMEENLDLQL